MFVTLRLMEFWRLRDEDRDRVSANGDKIVETRSWRSWRPWGGWKKLLPMKAKKFEAGQVVTQKSHLDPNPDPSKAYLLNSLSQWNPSHQPEPNSFNIWTPVISKMAEEETKVTVTHTAAEEFVIALLEASGVSRKNAKIVAQGLVQADLRGVESHGINRIPSYLSRIRNGVLDPKAEPALTQVTPVVAQVPLTRPFTDMSSFHR